MHTYTDIPQLLSTHPYCHPTPNVCAILNSPNETEKKAVLTKKVVDLPTTTTVDAVSGFDASRSGRVGRVLSDASKGGVRLGRLGSDFSLAGDTSKSEMRLGWLGSKSSLAGDTSKKSGKSVVIADDDEKAGSRQGSSASGIVDPRLGGVTEAQEDLEANEHAAGTE